MLYRHRQILAAIFAMLILAIGYFFDLRNLQENNNELIANENALRQPLPVVHAKPVSLQKKEMKLSAVTRLQSEILNMVDASQVVLNSMTRVEAPPNAVANDEYYQLVLMSDYKTFLRFLNRMNEATTQYFLRHVYIQINNHEQLQIELVLHAREADIKHEKNSEILAANINNPFCTSTMNDRQEQTDQLRMYDLSQLIMLGTINLQEKIYALILFPNGVIKQVAVNEKLGKEQGIITAISANSVTLNLTSHQTYQLKTE